MIRGWAILALSLGYVGLLFWLAYWGDRRARRRGRAKAKPIIYSLSLAVYCTSWTFYGSVGLAAKTGYDFLAIYVGPILVFALGWPLLGRLIRISKSHNINSIADFIAARYGKSQWLAAAVTVIAAIGTLPYLALQLKAVSVSFTVLMSYPATGLAAFQSQPAPLYTALAVALLLALFAALFGTRHVDATEHNEGLILAIAFESTVKLLAFIAVGAFVTWGMFGGFGDLGGRIAQQPALRRVFLEGIDGTSWMTMCALSVAAILCLPRQFHVTVVENTDPGNLDKAAWLFPLYLVAINVFVIPIAVAGLSTFPPAVDSDTFVLALPLAAHQVGFAILAFIGGLSAATGMAIVCSIAISKMVSNDLVMPLLLHRRLGFAERRDMGRLIRHIRRAAIFGILLLGYCYYWLIGDSLALASIGLISFAAIAQIAPPLLGGLIWRGANAKGALAGVLAGFGVWAYTLLLPSLAHGGWAPAGLLRDGPFGLAFLRPEALFGVRFDPLTHGVFWSLVANIGGFIAGSHFASARVIERVQANAFIDADATEAHFTSRVWPGPIRVAELAALVAQYLGADRVARDFAEFLAPPGEGFGAAPADIQLVRHAERLLASAIGAPSARLVMALALERQNLGMDGALRLLDDATAAIQYNRDLLQATLENVRPGISVFDRDLRLACWNRQFRELIDLPAALTRVGVSLEEIVRFKAERGEYGPGAVETIIADRLEVFVAAGGASFQWRRPNGTVLDIRTTEMPGGGYVTTYSEVTQHVEAAEQLAAANELLEQRVNERTAELTRLNAELREAKVAAEEANLGKTRFLAAVSHDLLQPLNAARLYLSSLIEQQGRPQRSRDGVDGALAVKIDTSLGAVEEILDALLDISRLDAGKLTAERQDMRLGDLFDSLRVEFAPLAERKGLELRVVPTTLAVNSDRRLLRRILQNLLSNAIRYTSTGKVLMGARRRGGRVAIAILDTGSGIPLDKQDLVFREFQRFPATAGGETGVGLGLSIVDRMARVLDHPVAFRSAPGRGTRFTVELPRSTAAVPPPRTGAATALPSLAGASILCIDDEPGVLDGMRMLLEGWGCRVHLAAGLAEALRLDAAELARLDAVIVDYHLNAEADGLRSLAELRQRCGVLLPAILITADRSASVREAAHRQGLRVLNKPVKPAALRALVTRLIAAQEAAE
ncbi:MAG TPA: NahK/ErcS family hybrid sensor histidine kinase/response regulator [Stellaceae bacterium]|jgi:Na+/proline symporter/signal transduction histidine kinase|nr:NahK/ErcS family hybrid sensor histidine kinase/response regulator [Stellaceae bacterium]